MSDVEDMLLLLVLCATVVLWLKLSMARERAMHEAHRQCEKHGLQLLDESVGLRAVRWRRFEGLRRLERGYGFDVSTDGGDRQPGRLWMMGDIVSELRLPSNQPASTEPAVASSSARAAGNVIPLRPAGRPSNERLH